LYIPIFRASRPKFIAINLSAQIGNYIDELLPFSAFEYAGAYAGA